jgi:hypothetical protein
MVVSFVAWRTFNVAPLGRPPVNVSSLSVKLRTAREEYFDRHGRWPD